MRTTLSEIEWERGAQIVLEKMGREDYQRTCAALGQTILDLCPKLKTRPAEIVVETDRDAIEFDAGTDPAFPVTIRVAGQEHKIPSSEWRTIEKKLNQRERYFVQLARFKAKLALAIERYLWLKEVGISLDRPRIFFD